MLHHSSIPFHYSIISCTFNSSIPSSLTFSNGQATEYIYLSTEVHFKLILLYTLSPSHFKGKYYYHIYYTDIVTNHF